MSYSFQIVTASALERRMVLQKHWERLEKEAKKDLQPRKNTRKMKRRQIEDKNNACDNAASSAADTMGKAEPETVKPEPETDPVVHVPVAQYVTEETDLLQLLRDNLPVISIKGAGSVTCDSRNKCGGLEPSLVSAYREGQNTSISTTSTNDVDTVNLNRSAQCVFASSSKRSGSVPTDEPRTLNQDASLREDHMNPSTENPNTSLLSTNIKNCKEESESWTRSVTSDNDAVTGSAIDVDDNDRESSSSSLMLTGLHTCGNLAPNIFRIFLANPDARVLCNVGCCYQLLTEEFWTEEGYTKGKQP